MCSDCDSVELSATNGAVPYWYKTQKQGNAKDDSKLETARYYLNSVNMYETCINHTQLTSTNLVH